MKKIYCDRCEKEIHKIEKKNFFGFIPYLSKDYGYNYYWKEEKIICDDCGKELKQWWGK